MSQRMHIPATGLLVIPSDGNGGVCSYRCASNAADTTTTSVVQFAVTAGAAVGTFQVGENATWAGGSGVVLAQGGAAALTGLVVLLVSGTIPAAAVVITGGTSAATSTVASTVTTLTETSAIVDANATPWNQAHGGNAAGGGAALATTVAGDLIVTSDGFWATVASKVGSRVVVIAPVPGIPNGWRHMTNPANNGKLPAGAASVAIYSASLLQGARAPRGTYISKLLVTTFVAADYAITIGDGYGTAILPTIPVRGLIAPLSILPVDIQLEHPHRGPFSVRFGNATPTGVVYFDGQA